MKEMGQKEIVQEILASWQLLVDTFPLSISQLWI